MFLGSTRELKLSPTFPQEGPALQSPWAQLVLAMDPNCGKNWKRQELSLSECFHNKQWPYIINLPDSGHIELKPALDYSPDLLHFVTVFPNDQPAPSRKQLEAMHQLTEMAAVELSKIVLDNSGCYHVDYNGPEVASMPQITHIHIYLFKNRDEKVRTLARVFQRAVEQIDATKT